MNKKRTPTPSEDEKRRYDDHMQEAYQLMGSDNEKDIERLNRLTLIIEAYEEKYFPISQAKNI